MQAGSDIDRGHQPIIDTGLEACLLETGGGDREHGATERVAGVIGKNQDRPVVANGLLQAGRPPGIVQQYDRSRHARAWWRRHVDVVEGSRGQIRVGARNECRES